ncbi:MAG: 30S ribosome-binding factor RbfA [Acidobacteriota bacterium]
MPFRVEKFSSTLKNSLAEILLNKLNDPDLKIVSISNIVVSRDLKLAKIFVSTIGIETEELLKKLNKAKGFIKKELSRSMHLKYIPELQFYFDSAFEFDQKNFSKKGNGT